MTWRKLSLRLAAGANGPSTAPACAIAVPLPMRLRLTGRILLILPVAGGDGQVHPPRHSGDPKGGRRPARETSFGVVAGPRLRKGDKSGRGRLRARPSTGSGRTAPGMVTPAAWRTLPSSVRGELVETRVPWGSSVNRRSANHFGRRTRMHARRIQHVCQADIRGRRQANRRGRSPHARCVSHGAWAHRNVCKSWWQSFSLREGRSGADRARPLSTEMPADERPRSWHARFRSPCGIGSNGNERSCRRASRAHIELSCTGRSL